VLVPVLRSVIVPLVAVMLNVVTVGATYAVLALVFNGSFLGGPGYIDTISAGSIVTVIFGLSIDYEVFVLARMREEYVRSGDNDVAVQRGLAGTARVVTGAAFVMIAIFIAFGFAQFISIRNFGVALGVAVALDAFVIRLIALPAIMRWLGRWCWWMPRWLDRIVPHVDIEGSAYGRRASAA
jgi:RND superfamily putative drug exporter